MPPLRNLGGVRTTLISWLRRSRPTECRQSLALLDDLGPYAQACRCRDYYTHSQKAAAPPRDPHSLRWGPASSSAKVLLKPADYFAGPQSGASTVTAVGFSMGVVRSSGAA